MKNIFFGVVFCVLMAWLSSCEDMMGDFLEKAPGVDVTEDTIFSSRTQAETFLVSIYQYGIHSYLPYGQVGGIANREWGLLAGATDEAETCAGWYFTQSGTMQPSARITRMTSDGMNDG